MTPNTGKILLRYPRSLIDKYNRDKPIDYLGWGRIIVNDPRAFEDFQDVEVSIETAYVEGVCEEQAFFKVGDLALVGYMVFMNGRLPGRHKKFGPKAPVLSPHQRLMVLPNGDELYYANDGTDGHNDSDCYAVLENGKFIMKPGYLMISEPDRVEKIGHILVPEQYQVKSRDHAYACSVVNISEADAQKRNLVIGDRILCAGGATYSVKALGENFYIIKTKYLFAKLSR